MTARLKDYHASGVWFGKGGQSSILMRATSAQQVADAIPNCSLYALRKHLAVDLRKQEHIAALDQHPPGTLLIRPIHDWYGPWRLPTDD